MSNPSGLDTGEILFGQGYCLVLFSPLFDVLLETELPFEGGRVVSIYPSDSNSFYIIFESRTPPTEEEPLLKTDNTAFDN